MSHKIWWAELWTQDVANFANGFTSLPRTLELTYEFPVFVMFDAIMAQVLL